MGPRYRDRFAPRSLCAGCGKQTKTIVGRCPNCGAPKSDAAVAPPRYLLGTSLFEDLDNLVLWLVAFAPGAILLVLGLWLVESTALELIGLLLVLAVLAIPFFDFRNGPWQ